MPPATDVLLSVQMLHTDTISMLWEHANFIVVRLLIAYILSHSYSENFRVLV